MKSAVVSAAAVAALVSVTISRGLAAEPGSSTQRVLELRPVIEKSVNDDLSRLKDIYEDIHRHPELSYHEERTAAKLAGLMRELGFEVTENVGGAGIVCVLKNGDGPTLLIRTDMDALPVAEQTGLAYASQVRTRDKNGNDVGVMHACGHDMHMTIWLGTAKVLSSLKDHWHGTLIFIGQPAEEVGGGARKMLEDGLFRRFPRPDSCLALHCHSSTGYGDIAYTAGQALANVDSVDITVRGKGGHGSAPQTTIDPIVLAARIILDLQTLVSRENNPGDPAVVTVGSIHGGTKHNIIPSEVKLQLTVRTTKDSVRKNILEGIARIAKADAVGARAPEPIVHVDPGEFTPALVNNTELTQKTITLFRELLGNDHVRTLPPSMGGEDFSRYGREGVPIFMYSLGTVDPRRAAEARREGATPLPSLHSDHYYPVPEPSIRMGVLTMSLAALNVLGK
jgi:hippurate hydrolase